MKKLIGYRKFTAFILYFVSATVLMILDFVSGDVYMQQVTLGLSALMAGNLVEHITETVKSKIKGKLK